MSMRLDILKLIEEIGPSTSIDLADCVGDAYTRQQIGNNTYQLKEEGLLEIDKTRCYSLTPKGVLYLFKNNGSGAEPANDNKPADVKQPSKAGEESPTLPDEAAKPETPENDSSGAEVVIDGGWPDANSVGELMSAINTDVADDVNHPEHYTSHPSGIECIQITEHMTFNCGNAVKYLWRGEFKGNQVKDLKKAHWHIEREIKRLEATACPK